MSVHITSPIWKLNLPCAAKTVLLKYGDCADDQGRNAFPSHKHVASQVGVSLATVKRLVAAFKADGVLVAEANGGSGRRSVNYRIDVVKAGEIYGWRRKNDTETPFAKPGEKAHRDPLNRSEKGLTKDKKNVNGTPGKGSSSEPLTVSNHQNRQAPPARATAADACADAGGLETDKVDETAPSLTRSTDRPRAVDAHWKAKQGELTEIFGDAFKAWIKPLMPLADNGEQLVLGAPTRFWRDHVAGNYAQQLAESLGRRISVVFHNSSVEALRQRGQKAQDETNETAPP